MSDGTDGAAGVSLAELTSWDEETSAWWKKHLEANAALLELPCDIGGSANVRELVRHIWSVQLRWVQRLAALPVTPQEEMPQGPLPALYDLHLTAVAIFRELLEAPPEDWAKPFKIDWNPAIAATVSRRKIAAHMLFHGQRHWAQMATLVRTAGFPSGFRGDMLLSAAID
jgi:uncharacterized damage-inducible protein DinB